LRIDATEPANAARFLQHFSNSGAFQNLQYSFAFADFLNIAGIQVLAAKGFSSFAAAIAGKVYSNSRVAMALKKKDIVWPFAGCRQDAGRKEEISMKLSGKLSGSILVLVSMACAVATPGAFAQKTAYNFAPSVVPASAEWQPMEEAATVQATLNQFDSAVASRDLAQLQAVGIKPGSAKNWQKFFKSNPEATVTDDCPASTLTILNDTAVWSCTETVTVISEGKPVPFALGVRFTFAKRNGVWTIADRR
jgi:hypothetical protein